MTLSLNKLDTCVNYAVPFHQIISIACKDSLARSVRIQVTTGGKSEREASTFLNSLKCSFKFLRSLYLRLQF